MSRSSSRGPQRPAQVAVQELEPGPQARTARTGSHEDAGEASEPPASHGVALLRIALLLKQPDGPDIDEAIARVAERMSLDEAALRGWIAANTGLLRATAPERGHLRLQHPMD